MSSDDQPGASARTLVVRLHPDTEARIALRIAALVVRRLSQPQPATEQQQLLTASEVSKTYRVHRGWVYEHADELGAIRIGDGARPRIRFDAKQVAAALQPDRTPTPRQPNVKHKAAHTKLRTKPITHESPVSPVIAGKARLRP